MLIGDSPLCLVLALEVVSDGLGHLCFQTTLGMPATGRGRPDQESLIVVVAFYIVLHAIAMKRQ